MKIQSISRNVRLCFCLCHCSEPGTAWTGDFWTKSISLKFQKKYIFFFRRLRQLFRLLKRKKSFKYIGWFPKTKISFLVNQPTVRSGELAGVGSMVSVLPSAPVERLSVPFILDFSLT